MVRGSPIWGIIGTQCRDEWEMEAGQIMIDKRRHMDALLLSNWMLDDWEFWFKLSDGDKDIFRFAFLAVGARSRPRLGCARLSAAC